jgi:hypothetical protein
MKTCVKCGGVVVGDIEKYWLTLDGDGGRGAVMRIERRGAVCRGCLEDWLHRVANQLTGDGDGLKDTCSSLEGVIAEVTKA